MKIKPGVNIQGISIKMRPVFIFAGKIWARYGQKLVITAGMEGEHSDASLHPFGYAVDMRTRYFDAATRVLVAQELSDALGSDYDVVLEEDEFSNHIHAEYDPKIVV